MGTGRTGEGANQPAPPAVWQLGDLELKTCYREPIRQTAPDRSREHQPSKAFQYIHATLLSRDECRS